MKTLLKLLLILFLLWIAWRALGWVIGLMIAGTVLLWMFLVLFGVPLLVILGIIYVLKKL